MEPPWLAGEEREISEGETAALLKKFLDWLQDHDLAHFFVHEVDPQEYPSYKLVRKPQAETEGGAGGRGEAGWGG